jgi:hypothetical protein
MAARAVKGVVTQSNSRIGEAVTDLVGSGRVVVVELSNGNYVILSPVWNDSITGKGTSAR